MSVDKKSGFNFRKFSSDIVSYRSDNDLTLAEAAAKMKISRDILFRSESCAHIPRADVFYNICRALKKEMTYYFYKK